MATITIQLGHCFRTSGATGTVREQEFADKVGNITASKLRSLGHTVHMVLADTPAPYPQSDAFIALHTDGSTNQNRRGASVGYPDENGARLARAWKRAHSRLGFPGGFLNDNYTAALRSYYAYGRAKAKHRFLAEHGTTTNPADRTWLFDNLDLCAQAHVDAVGELFGHPTTPAPSPIPQNTTVVSTMEVEMQVQKIKVEMPLDDKGRGNVSVPYEFDKILGFLPHSEVRPNVDGRYDEPANSVTFTPEGSNTVVVIQGGTPLGRAIVWLSVVG